MLVASCLSVTPGTVACEASLSMVVSLCRNTGVAAFLSRGCSHPGIEPGSPGLQDFTTELPGKPIGLSEPTQ